MSTKNNLIIVCQPALSRKSKTSFYILESQDGCKDISQVEEMTLIGDAAIIGHIVGIERTLIEAKKKYRQLLKLAEARLKLDVAA